jgi:small-conductance mechanosensitive channel
MNANRLLSFPIADFGGAQITIGRLILACAVIAVSIVLSRLLVRVLSRIRRRMPTGGTTLYILEKLGGYGIVVVGLLFGLSSLGVNLSTLAVFAGALGIGVGLGLQGVVKEFVSGLVLLFDSIISVGDYIELPGGNTRGIVMEIGARATRIKSNDNVDILVPNSRLIEERFINWTLEGQTRRIHVPFSVAYGADKAVVRDVVIAAAKGISATLPDDEARRTQVWLVGFGDSALNFELVVWPALEAARRPAAMHAAYTWAIDDALRASGIEIPFPQREIRLRSVFGREGDSGLEAIGQRVVAQVSAGSQTGTGAATSRNDAEQDLLRPDPLQQEIAKGSIGQGLKR